LFERGRPLLDMLIDAGIDALNPRTAGRHLPTGQVKLPEAVALWLASAAGLVIAAFLLNCLCFYLSPIALVVVCFYSLTKRFTDFTHVFLGVALALAPIGAWLAVKGEFAWWPMTDSALLPILLAVAVVFWLVGFDIIYAQQDYDFDRQHGLHSLVVRWGPKNALHAAFLAHMTMCGVLFAFAEDVSTDPEGRVHTFCHSVPGKWHTMGVVLSAAGSLQWFRNQLWTEEWARAKAEGREVYEEITAAAATAPRASEGLLFLPYLTGERTPHKDPFARAAFIGLSLRSTKAYMSRAVMEGVAYAMNDSTEIMRGMGVEVSEVRCSGGGARSKFWRQKAALPTPWIRSGDRT